ncbi:hypothetical protein ACFL0T_03385 [Candidatus Omnitrophota bacterium]
MNLNQTELKKIRKSGIIAAIIFTLVGTLHLYRGHAGFSAIAYILSIFFFTMTRFFPHTFKKITETIGAVLTGLALSIVFFLVIMPIGLIRRLFGKQSLEKEIERSRKSYWVKKAVSEEDSSQYQKQF